MPARKLLDRRIFLAGVFAACIPLGALAQTVDINGVYRAEGRNPDGSAYSGTAVMAERNGAVQINWTVGNSTYSGNGMRRGQVVMVNWGQATPVVYVIMPDGNLHGMWDNGRALERLMRQ